MNSKLHTVCDSDGPLIILLLSEDQMSDHQGARLLLDAFLSASHLYAGRGYDSSWFHGELEFRRIDPCVPSSRNGKVRYTYNIALYRQRHKVENLFATLKN